jgi:hypothetical protein
MFAMWHCRVSEDDDAVTEIIYRRSSAIPVEYEDPIRNGSLTTSYQ